MSLINKVQNMQINGTKIGNNENNDYTIPFIKLGLETLETDYEHIIKYDRKNSRYVMLINRRNIHIYEDEEALIKFLRFRLKIMLETHALNVTIVKCSILDYGKSRKDGTIQKYIWSQEEMVKIDLAPYHDFNKEEFDSMEFYKQISTETPKQLEAIPLIIDTIDILLHVIKKSLVRNIRKSHDNEIDVELFIRENDGE